MVHGEKANRLVRGNVEKTDYLDEQIVRLYTQDGRMSSEHIAKQLNVSAATIRRRTKRLLDNNMIHFVSVVDPANFGQPVAAIITLSVDVHARDSVYDQLSRMEEVKWTAVITGHYDLMSSVRFESEEKLSNFVTETLRKINGITDIETFPLLKMHKEPLLPLT